MSSNPTFVNDMNLFGNHIKQIPCIVGEGSPNESTYGAVGMLYMDSSNNGEMYKCVKVEDDKYTWEKLVSENNGENLTIRDMLEGEIFVLDATGGGNDTPDSGGDTGGDDSGGNEGDNPGNTDTDIPSENLSAYFDMRTPLTADNLITDLSGNERNIVFYPANGEYKDGYLTRGVNSKSVWTSTSADYAPASGVAKKMDASDTLTVFVTFAVGEDDLTPLWGTGGDYNASLITGGDGLLVYSKAFHSGQAASTQIPVDYTIVTAAVSLNKSGNQRTYINGELKLELEFKDEMEIGTDFYLLVGHSVKADPDTKIYNAAVYSAELTAEQIATISATLLANAGGVTA